MEKLTVHKERLDFEFKSSDSDIGYLFLDDLLPEEIATQIADVFPKPAEMVLKKSLREYKYVAAQMNLYPPLLEEIIYAFQDKKVVAIIGEICKVKNLNQGRCHQAASVTGKGRGDGGRRHQ